MRLGSHQSKTRTLGAVLVILAATVWVAPTAFGSAANGDGTMGLKKALAPFVGPRDSVMVTAPDGRPLVVLNGDVHLVPASILKILTALAALEKLGYRYRFQTDFYLDPTNNLKIKGYGDPLLVSERLADIAHHLAQKTESVQDLILDESYFTQPVKIPGRGTSDEPYDAPNGALCVNFNTVAFRREKGRWISDEPQTPLLPMVIPKIDASGLSIGRITLAADSTEALTYTGELFRYFLNQSGITVKGTVRAGSVSPGRDRLLWRYLSQDDLSHAVANLLEFSNNFIANQILLVMGAHHSGAPATMQKGLEELRHYYTTELGIGSGTIVEASGISRYNRITAQAMMTILQRFAPHHQLMRHNKRQYYKTGHLKGVRSRAGYLTSAGGGLYHFVVIINTAGRSTDRIMRILESRLK